MEIKVDNASIEQLVKEHIRVAVIEALNGKSDYLIGRLVDEALNKTDPNTYNRKSIIDNMVDEMIRNAASEAANEWLEEQKPKVKKLVYVALSDKSDGLVAAVVEQMVAKLGGGLDVGVWLRPKE